MPGKKYPLGPAASTLQSLALTQLKVCPGAVLCPFLPCRVLIISYTDITRI